MNSYIISTDKTKLDITLIHKYLSEDSYWAQGRSIEAVKTTIENCICFGLYANSNQIGFARVVTDYAVYGWIMDVFVLPEYRGNGLGKMLMTEILNHPVLSKLPKLGLSTLDAHGLYKQFGFEALEHPEWFMNKKQ